MTPHQAIDWERVYERAALVVDTVNSSRGRVVHSARSCASAPGGAGVMRLVGQAAPYSPL